MYISETSVNSVTSNYFSLFGLPTSDSINLIIASVAILGFLTSLIISIISIRQVRRLYKKQDNISLFDKRYELLTYFGELVEKVEFPILDDINKFSTMSLRLTLLFNQDDVKELFNTCMEINDYNRKGQPYTDYSKQYEQKYSGIPINIKTAAYKDHFIDCLYKLSEETAID